MITALRLFGVILLILVGYHYINEPLGFSIASSIATAIFAICLTALYQPYQPDTGNWIGWGLIGFGCFFIAGFKTFSWLLAIPSLMIILGYRLATLPFDFGSSRGGDGGSSCGFDSCDGDGGCGD
ncbi:hypothetical protein [Sedimenticola selenatireducens]|uniref:hypothetical protein n=1 Tax=Sedimenticola selenatireducens TaxID=191960 RepID=UPI0012F84DB2|nr:hypothetical protein [Sedimenticola selenatireducens]